MASFTSTQTGNWNDGGTWGNDSPGVKGTDWPGSAGDTATISAGHTVTYNVSETNELGDIEIYGKLAFDDSADRLLTLGDNDINVRPAGELEIGTSGTPFDKAYTAKILWNTTSDSDYGLKTPSSGSPVVNIYGAADYCTTWETTLANDAENTDGDTTIKTVDDMSSDWHEGDEILFLVEEVGDSSIETDGALLGEIQSMSGTSITLDVNVTCDAGVGSTWTSRCVNVTRNVELGKYNADRSVGGGSRYWNSNRPLVSTGYVGDGDLNLSYCSFIGMKHIALIAQQTVTQIIVRNGDYGFYGSGSEDTIGSTISGEIFGLQRGATDCVGVTINANIWACRYGSIYNYGGEMAGDVVACDYGCYGVKFYQEVSGDIHACNAAFRLNSWYTLLTGQLYSCNYGFMDMAGHIVCNDAKIGYNGATSKPNTTYDFDWQYHEPKIWCRNTKFPLAGVDLNYRGGEGRSGGFLHCEDYDQTLGASRTYYNSGTITRVACDGGGDRPSEDPDGGNGYCLEMADIQSLVHQSVLPAWDHRGDGQGYRIWATSAAGSKTYTFKVQTTYAGISAGGLTLRASYLTGSGAARSVTTHAPAIAQRSGTTDWTQTLAVTVNPGADGWINFEIELSEYESGNEVWIWPEVVIS